MPLTARLAIVLLALFALIPAARSQSCNFMISGVAFGDVDVISGGVVDTTATLSISCTGLPLTSVRICPNIGSGSGGADASSRAMSGPGVPVLDYQLYRDPARTVIWGSAYSALPGDPPTIVLPLGLSGSANTNRTIYARVSAGQASASAGAYVSNFAGAETIFDYGLDILGLLDCNALPILSSTAHPAFDATANVVKTCLLNAQDLDFGTHGVLSANVDSNGQVELTCTPGTPYTVELDNGLSGSGPAARNLSKGAETITYGLYKDAGRAMPWGDSATPGSAVSGTGDGMAQNLTVYGRVPAQATPTPGTYTDTIVVTLTY